MSATSRPREGAALEELLEFLKTARGFDFTGYKRATIDRRIAKRMEAVGVAGYDAYRDYLEVHPDEFAFLFNTILINVTGFFRDRAAWDYVVQETLPRVIEAVGPRNPIRIWCAGCASGEETYSLAMILAEALGTDEYLARVKIYATDVDEEALNEARLATYAAQAVEAVPDELRERYFDRIEQRYAFRKDLRRTVIFGRNDLVQDAPISRIDLLTCRNTLMYFNADTQAQILSRFHFALNDWGSLYLGKSEMLITHSELFRPSSLKQRVFTKVVRATLRDRLLAAPAQPSADGGPPMAPAVRESAFDAAPVAQIAIDADGLLVLANQQARLLLGLSSADVGRPLKDLEASYRPVELRAHIDAAREQGASVRLSKVTLPGVGDRTHELDVQIVPMRGDQGPLGTTVTYADVTDQRRLQHELEGARNDLELAYAELQSTVEELETTNEELQSTNEELETTNEELQSTNEELETMNEELQSTNEELETMNDELRLRSLELDEVNAFLESILTSMKVAVVVLDQNLEVRVWNTETTDLWGLRREEAEGENFLGLDFGLPVERLAAALRDVVRNGGERTELVLDATNRRGRAVECRVVVLPMRRDGDDAAGAIVLMEEAAEPSAG